MLKWLIMKILPLFHSSLVRRGAVALTLGLFVGQLYASDDKPASAKEQAAGAADPAEMMKHMAELSAPGPEHKVLASLAGEWDAETRCNMMTDANGKPTVNKGTCKSRLILGGRFLEEEFKGEMMGQPFNGRGLVGYDKEKKKYISTWVDDMGTGVFVSEGTADASGKVITQEGKMDDPTTGEKDKTMRLITRIISPDKHTFEMHDLGKGADSKVMEITYTRKSGTSTPPTASTR
jgi:hypothetical protein